MDNQEELMKIIQGLKEELETLKRNTPGQKIGPKPKKKYKPRVKQSPEPEVLLAPKRGAGIKFRGNIFNDNEGLCAEDKDFDNKIKKKSRPVPRTRPPAVKKKIHCKMCHKEFESFVEHSYFVCPKCAKV